MIAIIQPKAVGFVWVLIALSWTSSNIININTEKDLYIGVPRSASLALCLMKTQSKRNKTADFVDYVSEYKFDLVAITETWLTSNDDSLRAQLWPNGYRFFDEPRKGRS